MTALASSNLSPDVANGVACDHCGLPVPRGLFEPDATVQFCCNGCRTVYDMIRSHGLDDYYRVRDTVDAPRQSARTSGERYQGFDSPAFQAEHCHAVAGGCYVCSDLRLEGVHCAACMWLVERLPKMLPGVASVRLHLRDAVARVIWNPQETQLSSIASTLDRLGYPSHPARHASAAEVRKRNERTQLIRLGVAGACAGNNMLLAIALYAGEFSGIEGQYATLLRAVSAGIGLLSLAWPGSVFFRGAWVALRNRVASLDVPIALALAAGGVAGLVNTIAGTGEIYFDSLSVLVFLLLVGRWFQARQQRWADEAVGLLGSFTPTMCRIVRDQGVAEVPTDSLTPDAIVEVRSGELIPADGVVTVGMSKVDRSLLSGESVAVPVEPDDEVFAGTQNIGSTLHVRVTSTGSDTRVARLMHLVNEGVRDKPAIVQFTDKAAMWFVTVVVAAATATFIGWSLAATTSVAVSHTIALLIVACPCALGLATPLTMAVAIGVAARRQMLVKNASVFEALAGTGRMLLDKTGTITRGRPTVAEWVGPDWLGPVVANAESHSSHPVARALVEAYGDVAIDRAERIPKDVEELGDGGIRAMVDGRPLLVGSPRFLASRRVTLKNSIGDKLAEFESRGLTAIGIALDGTAEAACALGDKIHAAAADAIVGLAKQGWDVTIVSGDAQGVVHRVASEVHLDESRALGGVLPEQKLELVGDNANGRQNTVMIGDGVNDAAALAAADVGIAVEGGAEASLAAADVYVAAPGLMPIVELIELAKRTKRVVRQNLVIALGYNLIAVSLAAAGWITPLIAAILMPISSATVLASAMSVALGSRS